MTGKKGARKQQGTEIHSIRLYLKGAKFLVDEVSQFSGGFSAAALASGGQVLPENAVVNMATTVKFDGILRKRNVWEGPMHMLN